MTQVLSPDTQALSPDTIETRRTMRRHYRAARRELPPHIRAQAARAITQRVCRSNEFSRARRIACYFANDGEVDTAAIIATAWERKKSIAVPVIDFRNRMRFVEYRHGDRLTTGKWGLVQPAGVNRVIPPGTIDLVIMPLVAFDHDGNRLGRGGGYYDRFLGAGYRQNRAGKPFLLGLAYNCQRADKIPAADWDIPLHAVATESGINRKTD